MPEHTSGATDGNQTGYGTETSQPDQDTQADGQPSWAGAMAQIDAEIAELQEMLAKRRIEAAEADEADPETGPRDDEPDSVA